MLFVVILAMAGWWLTNNKQIIPTKPAGTATVIMKQDSFDPETLTIKKGTTVIFKNDDSVERWPASNLHPTHGIYPEFDPQQPVSVNQSWQFTFDKVGSWKYHDHLIPSIRGVIIVN